MTITFRLMAPLIWHSPKMSVSFEAYGWHVQVVENGDTDLDAIDAAIKAAQAVTDKLLCQSSHNDWLRFPNKAGTKASIATLWGCW